ncbi:MAG: hypothetical protein U1E65_14460 [Myxococcota bacterium]
MNYRNAAAAELVLIMFVGCTANHPSAGAPASSVAGPASGLTAERSNNKHCPDADGGVHFVDGGLQFIDGGVQFIDGGLQFVDGGTGGCAGESAVVGPYLMPQPLTRSACASFHDGHIYCFGGLPALPAQQFLDFDPATQQVSVRSAPDLPGGFSFSCVTQPDRITCVGGAPLIGGQPKAAFEIDPLTGSLTSQQLGLDRTDLRCALAGNGGIYCLGAVQDDAEILRYDFTSNTFTLMNAAVPPHGAGVDCYPLPSGHLGCLIQVSTPDGSALRAIDYDPVGDTLSMRAATFTPGRSGFSCAKEQSGLVLCGGGNISSGVVPELNDIFTYDPEADSFALRPVTWPTKIEMQAAAAGGDGRIYAFGGFRAPSTSFELVLRYTPPCP